LYCSDEAENIIVLVNGYFPVAKFNLKELMSANSKTIVTNRRIKVQKIIPSLDCSELILKCVAIPESTTEMAQHVVLSVDTRILPARILPNVFNKAFKAPNPVKDFSLSSFFTRLHEIKDLMELFDKRINDPLHIKWKIFVNRLRNNMLNVLGEKLQKRNLQPLLPV
jgi:hypothetical protein